MTFVAFPSTEMCPTALAPNIVAATYGPGSSTAKSRRLKKAAVASAFIATDGARWRFIVLDEQVYKTTTGGVLLLAGAATILRRDGAGAPDREAPFWGVLSVGVVVGLISGFTGVSGGVFLAPTLIGLQWASPKQAAALSAPFILANSAVDLIGVFLGGQLPAPHFGLYALMALGGAVLGTAIGLRWLGQAATRFILAAILLAAGIQLLFF
jgi:uncharacterized protein